MKTKPRFPRSRYLICALIGGVMGVLTNTLVLLQSETEDFQNTMILIIYSCIPAAGVGALFGILAGRIGYAIKPRKGVSIGGAAVGPILVGLSLVGFANLRQTLTINHQQKMYPEHKPIPTLNATFQELASGEYFPSCAISSDGSRLALGSESQITFWDLNKKTQIGEPLFSYKNPYNIWYIGQDLVFNPDGNTLALGYQDGVILWDVQTGKQMTLPVEGGVVSLAFSPDGQLLAVVAQELFEGIILLDVQTGEQLAQLEGLALSMAFSPDGRLLAAITPTGTVLWDPSTGEEVAPLGDYYISSSALFSPDSKLMAATLDKEDQITLLDTATFKPVGRLNVEGSPVAFSPDGSRLAVVTYLHRLLGDDRGISLWDVDSRTRLASTRASIETEQETFSPDGQKLIMYGISGSDLSDWHWLLYLWDANSLEPLGSLAGPQTIRSEVFVLPDGRMLACYWNDGSPDQIGIWTIESP